MVGTAQRTAADQIAQEVREWLSEHWDPALEVVKWRRTLLESGWGMPMWPREWWGRGLSKELARVVADEFERVGATGLVAGGVASGMAAPVILEHGTDTQRRRYIPRIFTGEEGWCQFFSEPGAGSDLAGITTRAERHGDEWIVNGQKVWTSGAQSADQGLLLARTNWDVPKHQGLSYFIIPMHQPGIDVRPLKQINGNASFCEVFFTDARLPAENLIDKEGNGWAVAITTLMNERVMLGGTDVRVGRQPVPAGAQAEARRRMGRMDTLDLVRAADRAQDPVARQLVAELYTLQRIQQWNQQRSKASVVAGKMPGPEASIAKLMSGVISRRSAIASAQIAGAATMLAGADAPFRGVDTEQIGYHSSTIGGGTENIQKNIVGERVLGLPKDPQVDREVAFREVRVNAPKPR